MPIPPQLKNPVFYLYFLLAAVSVLCQLRYLNKGLEFFDALQVVPIFQCFIIFSNALAGIVYFHDMRTAAAYKLVLFGVGGAICIAGIAILLIKKTSPHGARAVVAAPLTRLRSLQAGLQRRGLNEAPFLKNLEAIADSGQTAADVMLAAYNTRWEKSVDPAYDEYVY